MLCFSISEHFEQFSTLLLLSPGREISFELIAQLLPRSFILAGHSIEFFHAAEDCSFLGNPFVIFVADQSIFLQRRSSSFIIPGSLSNPFGFLHWLLLLNHHQLPLFVLETRRAHTLNIAGLQQRMIDGRLGRIF